MIRAPCFHGRGNRFDPWSKGTKSRCHTAAANKYINRGWQTFFLPKITQRTEEEPSKSMSHE